MGVIDAALRFVLAPMHERTLTELLRDMVDGPHNEQHLLVERHGVAALSRSSSRGLFACVYM